MENKTKISEAHNESYIGTIKSPQETPFNHTMVGSKQKKTTSSSLYNPHNYRLYFSFKKEQFNPEEGMVGVWLGKYKNHGSEFTAVGEGIRVTIKKTQAEIINKLTEQEWFAVNRASARTEITELLQTIETKCIASFKSFIEVYGGSTDYKILHREERPNLILNTKSDNKVMHEPYIDSLPLDMTFETSIVKKAYKESNIEFKEPIYVARYLENSALNEFAPQIAEAIKQVAMSNPGERLRYIKSQINKFTDVKALYSEIMVLEQVDKNCLSDWIFERFKT